MHRYLCAFAPQRETEVARLPVVNRSAAHRTSA
jgi:hypothetical protein